MTGRAIGPDGPGSVISLPIDVGTGAPRIARNAVLSRLGGCLTDDSAGDVALIVSELVTNSVLHADLGSTDTVLVELTIGDDRLAITVTDRGSGQMPRLLARDPTRPNGVGLRLVDQISASWGVRRNPGATEVWCELALGGPAPGGLEARETLA